MEIPVSIFLSFIVFSFTMAIIGIWKKAPFLMFIGGAFIAFWAIQTDTIVIDSFGSGNTNNLYAYNVEETVSALTLNAGGVISGVEYASSSSSQLIGHEINCIDVFMRKATGSPTGIATIGNFVNTGVPTMDNTFGTIDVATLTTAFDWQTFCLSGDNTVVIENLDRFGVLYNSGDGSNNIQIHGSNLNPFDGTITIRQENTASSWTSTTNTDLTMRLYLSGGDFQITQDPYEFTELPKTFFALIGASMILLGALMVARND